eukprot:487043-Pleurochrysis_carterae.AAC.1
MALAYAAARALDPGTFRHFASFCGRSRLPHRASPPCRVACHSNAGFRPPRTQGNSPGGQWVPSPTRRRSSLTRGFPRARA